MPGQVLGGGFADIADAQRVDQPRQRGVLRCLDGGDDILRRLLAHAIEAGQRRGVQPVEVSGALHPVAIDQLIHQLLAEALDVQRAARSEVQNGLLALRRAVEAAGAARNGLVGQAHDAGAAHRAMHRHDEFALAAVALFGQEGNDFGDDVAGATHDHRVADADVLAPHFVLVVQRGIGHGDAADEDRLEARHRRDRPGAADLHLDVENLGDFFLRRVLVGDGEARCARDIAEPLLVGEAVDFVHHAVDVVGQRDAARADLAVIAQQAGGAAHDGALGRHRETPAAQALQHLGVGGRHGLPLQTGQRIGEEAQRPFRRDARVELAHAAGSSVARIGEFLLARLAGAFVHALEVAPQHEHLAANFEVIRDPFSPQAERDAAHRAQVAGDILAGIAVAARGAEDKAALHVGEADGQAVELRLGGILDLFAVQALADTAVEVGDVLLAEGVRQREHRRAVADLGEFRRRQGADALGGGLRADQLGMPRFQPLQLAEQAVVLGVRHARSVEHVVGVVVPLDLGAQRLNPLGGLALYRHAS